MLMQTIADTVEWEEGTDGEGLLLGQSSADLNVVRSRLQASFYPAFSELRYLHARRSADVPFSISRKKLATACGLRFPNETTQHGPARTLPKPTTGC